MADITRETIIEWAAAAKAQANCADLEPAPRDESLLRAAVAYSMLTRCPFPAMRAADGGDESFNRSSAIVLMAINFDDSPASTPERAALFAEVLRVR